MRKIFTRALILAMLAVLLPVFAWVAFAKEISPLSPEYYDRAGYVTSSADLLPPPPPQVLRDTPSSLPSKFDLRNVNGKSYVTSVKAQGPYATGWAFAVMGAMESNYLMQGGPALDLSEMHLAWFTYRNSDKSKAFADADSAYFEGLLQSLTGYISWAIPLLARLDGPVLEKDLPYYSNNKSLRPTPESYNRVLRFRDEHCLYMYGTLNSDTPNRNVVKRYIMANGALITGYEHAKDYFSKTDTGGTAFFKGELGTPRPQIALIVGWDDNYSRNNFKEKPNANGAWLIKNSLGYEWYGEENNLVGDDGYFWMSYEQRLDDITALIVEAPNTDMKAYYYDALGDTSHSYHAFDNDDVYSANVFKAERANEKLTEIGFYTIGNNQQYEVRIYTGLGPSMPLQSPVNGTPVATVSGTIPYRGYHTITLKNSVTLTKNDYFSVVLILKNVRNASAEGINSYATPNAVIEAGSFFSGNGGASWVTGISKKINACIKAFTITQTDNKNAPKISTSQISGGAINSEYSQIFKASGTKPITWSASGNVPTGLTVNSNGTFSGIPTGEGIFTFTVTASNIYGSDSKTFVMNTKGQGTGTAPKILTSFIRDHSTNYAAYETFTASGTTPITWSASGNLPAGLSMSTTGTLSGTPTQAGSYTFTVTASNSYGSDSKTFTTDIVSQEEKITTPRILTVSPPHGVINSEYSYTFTASGGPYIKWYATGDIPNGLSLSSDGTLSGIPTSAGFFTFIVSACNAAGWSAGKYTLRIDDLPAGTPPQITTSSISNGTVSSAYSQTFTASGTTPITWSVSGDIPAGLSMNSNGTLSGTPTRAGSYNFNVTASNAYGSDTKTFTINIQPQPVTPPATQPTITPTSFTCYVGNAITETMKLSTGTASKWSATGLPKGLTLKQTGAFSGKPSTAGRYTAKISAVVGGETLTANVTFTVEPKPAKPALKTAKLPDGAVAKSYSERIIFTGTEPVRLSITGLPNGLTFNPSTGYITGTPETEGTYQVKISAENTATDLDKGKAITKTIRLAVKAEAPKINPPSALESGIMNKNYQDFQFELLSGNGNIKWTASGLPLGLKLSTSGLLSGIPKKAGNFNITLKAVNSGGNHTEKVKLTVYQLPEITTKKLNPATTDKNYSVKLAAKGTTPITWSVAGLPDSLKLSQNTAGTNATITGTPSEIAKCTVIFTAENPAGSSTVSIPFEVKGVAPKITASLAKGKAEENYTGSKISAAGTKPITITCSVTAADLKKLGVSSLEELGLTFSNNPSAGTAELTGISSKSFKNLPITFKASNAVSSVTRKVNLTLAGEKPSFSSPSDNTVNITQAVNSEVRISFTVNGTKDISFSMNKIAGFTLNKIGDYTAELTGRAQSKPGKTNITITAQNNDGKATKKVVIQAIANDRAQPEIVIADDKESSSVFNASFMAQTEPAISFGSERTALSLGITEREMLEREGYVIAEVLPEISVNESGMYEIEIEFDERVEIGTKLFWFALPKNAQSSEDDEIAEFYDETGAEIQEVPANRIITVSAWFNEGVTYVPVIAVK